jgi:uncharacterized membrane protein YGL010W
MASLAEQMVIYRAFHGDPRNRLAYFIGVPLVTFSVLLVLSWFRFGPALEIPLSGATIFYVCLAIYCLSLDQRVALFQAPFTLVLLCAADWIARWPFHQSLIVFAVAFIGGWMIQLVGHRMERNRLAVAGKLLQIINAPLFLAGEALLALDLHTDLRRTIELDSLMHEQSLSIHDELVVSP